jgi:hypothetical protein
MPVADSHWWLPVSIGKLLVLPVQKWTAFNPPTPQTTGSKSSAGLHHAGQVAENGFRQTQSLRLPISSANFPTQHRWVVFGMTPFDTVPLSWNFHQLSKMPVRVGQLPRRERDIGGHEVRA